MSRSLRRALQWVICATLCFTCLFPTRPARAQKTLPAAPNSWRVNVRRNPASSIAHVSGVSTIIWGDAPAGVSLTISLLRNGQVISQRQLPAQSKNQFSISMDQIIADGDRVVISDPDDLWQKVIDVPQITYSLYMQSRMVTGKAPANIQSTILDSPHSLYFDFPETQIAATTDAEGNFTLDLRSIPYLAGRTGALVYVNAEGDRVYKPVFFAGPQERGKAGDWWADVILGKPDFSEITFNEVTAETLFNPEGVLVDRSTTPNRVYVYDGGNSRVLGLSHLGVCQAGTNAGGNCTTDNDCPGSQCQIQEMNAADLVLGQPSFSRSSCNGDSGYQSYPDVPLASADTLCGLREEQMSISEGGSGVTMALDAQGNLYVPDFFNNRILRYNRPFETDTRADAVWGQADFSGIFCNRGAGFSSPDNQSLCLAPLPSSGNLRTGVAVDPDGNLWVTDPQNNRVLRFPQSGGMSAAQADLVLGQPNLSSASSGSTLSQMFNPASIAITPDQTVYVADSLNNRILAFRPPFVSGMAARFVLPGEFSLPLGFGTAPDGSLWVNDFGHKQLVHFVNDNLVETIPNTHNTAGLGVDSSNNVYSAGWSSQAIERYQAPIFQTRAYALNRFPGTFNKTTNRSLYGGHGLEVTDDQLIYGDNSQLLFWNHPLELSNWAPADGFIGPSNYESTEKTAL